MGNHQTRLHTRPVMFNARITTAELKRLQRYADKHTQGVLSEAFRHLLRKTPSRP